MWLTKPICCWLLLSLRGTLVSSATVYEHTADRFNYDHNPADPIGVRNWGTTYSADCQHSHQSPVDVRTDTVSYDLRGACPSMQFRSTRVTGTLKNNGHSAAFELLREEDFQLTGVPYRPGRYYLHDFHVHYGGITRSPGQVHMDTGSEHTINGQRFDGEMHFVFYNSRYLDAGQQHADDQPDGIVVISILVERLPPGVPADSRDTAMLSEFFEYEIPRVYAVGSNVTTSVDLDMFFHRPCEFYTYPGSLTTPRCHEVVRWLIMREPMRVTDSAWFQLTHLASGGDFNEEYGNFRSTQPINNRIVEANFLPGRRRRNFISRDSVNYSMSPYRRFWSPFLPRLPTSVARLFMSRGRSQRRMPLAGLLVPVRMRRIVSKMNHRILQHRLYKNSLLPKKYLLMYKNPMKHYY